MKKNTLKIISFICLIMGFAISCTTNEYEIPNDGGGNALLVSSINDGLRPGEIEVRVGDTSKYNDLSIFSEDRLWTFPEGAVDILGSSNDITTDKKEFSVVFKGNEDNTPRSIEVLLQPVFNGPVPPEAATDTAFVRILPNIIADFTTDIPVVNGGLEIEAGETGNFTNTSSEMDMAEWLIVNNTTKVADSTETIDLSFQFKALGSYTVRLRAFDDEPFSQGFKTVNVNVVPSTQPVTVGTEVIERENGQLVIAYSRDLDPASVDSPSNFTLLVDGTPASIASVLVDPDTPSNLLVIPTVNIKNSQTATIAYNAVNLASADAAPAPSIPQTDIDIFRINLFANGVFEDIDSSVPGRFYGTNSFFEGLDASNHISIAITPGTGINGSSAMVFTFTPDAVAGDSRSAFGDGMNPDPMGRVVQRIEPLELKTYIMTAMVRYTGSAPGRFRFSVTSFPFNGGGIVRAPVTSGFVEGEFVKVRAEFTPNANTIAQAGLAYPIIFVDGVTGASVVTIDNIEVFEKEE
ncbi:hypothetical protein [Aquimarina algiphila]|uniref:hypothetical protein n=1 Tax=Aquimarina algiphila TaxID=2047982 RepID=UPI00232C523F|nr:hypothetical protein [Aquimarina algiphila]